MSDLRADACIARHGYHLVLFNWNSNGWRCERCGADYSMVNYKHPEGIKVRYQSQTTPRNWELWDGPRLIRKGKDHGPE